MRTDALDFLQKLLSAPSPSGYEGPARKVWLDHVRPQAESVAVDVHGNALASINPQGAPHVMLAGHIDEIGFQVCFIDERGFLRFRPIGGHDLQVVAGRRVQLHARRGPILGVVGQKPIHLVRERTRATKPHAEDLWIDAGFASRKEAEKLVQIGDPITYVDGFAALRGALAVARAFDDKVGAFVVAEVLRALAGRKGLKARVTAVATVQEEIGLRGARTSAFGLQPDVGIAVDVTWATDDPSVDAKELGEVKLGGGPVLARGPNANPPLLELLQKTARREGIPVQLRAVPAAGGNDGNALQVNRAGVATAVVGIPQRYMHSPSEICHLGDVEAAVALITQTIARLSSKTSFIPGG
ncbi:MAG: M42 family metallopeptidase [Proteobacteria bacterium]|nr:M42 family metallopeptidase [Pseudomonadota bacterium]